MFSALHSQDLSERARPFSNRCCCARFKRRSFLLPPRDRHQASQTPSSRRKARQGKSSAEGPSGGGLRDCTTKRNGQLTEGVTRPTTRRRRSRESRLRRAKQTQLPQARQKPSPCQRTSTSCRARARRRRRAALQRKGSRRAIPEVGVRKLAASYPSASIWKSQPPAFEAPRISAGRQTPSAERDDAEKAPLCSPRCFNQRRAARRPGSSSDAEEASALFGKDVCAFAGRAREKALNQQEAQKRRGVSAVQS